MKLIDFKKVKDGKYLKNYELTYLNKSGKEKIYEIVSRKEISDLSQLGNRVNGVSIIAICDGKLLLLREFRMGINRFVYNLCAGMLEDGEDIHQCIERELYEETGLKLKCVLRILQPSYSAVAISDIKTQIAFVEVCGEISDHSSTNEEIEAAFYTKEEVSRMLEIEEFSSRAQLAAYLFVISDITNIH